MEYLGSSVTVANNTGCVAFRLSEVVETLLNDSRREREVARRQNKQLAHLIVSWKSSDIPYSRASVS